jgi:outer membrane protein assembly factor BamB
VSVSQNLPTSRPPTFRPKLHSGLSRAAALCACAALVLLAGGCGGKKRPAAEKAEPLPLQSFARQWATDLQLKRDTLTSLHVREGAIFAYTRQGRVAALGRDTGSIQYWVTVQGGTNKLHPPIVMDQRLSFKRAISAPKYKEAERWEIIEAVPVVFPAVTTLEVYDRTRGTYVSSVDLKAAIRSDAVGANGTVYLGGAYKGGSRGAALDITQPYVAVRWEVMFPEGSISAAPALHGDTVYFAGENGSVIAVSAADRRPIWPLRGGAFQTGGPVVADLGVDDENLYVSSTDTKLYALNNKNGKIRWQYHAGAALRSSPAVTSDTVYQFVAGVGLAALAKGQGAFDRRPSWVAEDCTQFLAQDERNAYLRRRDGAVVARDKRTGELKFASRRRNEVFATNTSKEDGVVYAATKQGRVIAIKPVLKPGVVGEVVRMDEQTIVPGSVALAPQP